jgi:hypothetical protein
MQMSATDSIFPPVFFTPRLPWWHALLWRMYQSKLLFLSRQILYRTLFRILFAITLFNTAVINLEQVAVNGFTIANNELNRIWKEAVVTYFQILSQNLPRRTDQNNEASAVKSDIRIWYLPN